MDRLIPYFSIPFKKFGRDYKGCDCWGFVRLVLKNECNINLPILDKVKSINPTYDKSQFTKVNNIKDFDLVLMKGKEGIQTHIGFIYKNQIMHMTEKGVTSNNLKALDPIIIGIYRYKKG